MVNVPEDLKIRAAAAPLRPAITTLRWRDAVLAAGLGLSCCTAAGPNPADSPAGQVTVAPGIVFCLPSPAALERSVEAFQLITVRHGYDTFAFETRISVTPARVLVVGIDEFVVHADLIGSLGPAPTARTERYRGHHDAALAGGGGAGRPEAGDDDARHGPGAPRDRR